MEQMSSQTRTRTERRSGCTLSCSHHANRALELYLIKTLENRRNTAATTDANQAQQLTSSKKASDHWKGDCNLAWCLRWMSTCSDSLPLLSLQGPQHPHASSSVKGRTVPPVTHVSAITTIPSMGNTSSSKMFAKSSTVAPSAGFQNMCYSHNHSNCFDASPKPLQIPLLQTPLRMAFCALLSQLSASFV